MWCTSHNRTERFQENIEIQHLTHVWFASWLFGQIGIGPAISPRMVTMEDTRILSADDQADVLEALQILLKNEGFATEVVTSPRAVVEAVEKKAYDVLLLDLNYTRDTTSGGEGLELLSRIQAIDKTLPVVLMTAWGSVDLAVQALQGGGRDFVQKPWDNDRLLAVLRRHVEEGRLLREKKRQEKSAEWFIREMEEARDIQQRL